MEFRARLIEKESGTVRDAHLRSAGEKRCTSTATEQSCRLRRSVDYGCLAIKAKWVLFGLIDRLSDRWV